MDEPLSVFQSGGGGKIKIRDGDFLPMMRYVRREGMMSGNRHKCILRGGLVVERTFFQLTISKNRCQRILAIDSVAPQAASDSATGRTAGTASPLDSRRTLNHSLPGLNPRCGEGQTSPIPSSIDSGTARPFPIPARRLCDRPCRDRHPVPDDA